MWYYIIWLDYCDVYPIEIEDIDMIRKLSFVEKKDVIRTILKVIFSEPNDEIWNEAYNLCFDEELTLNDLLSITADKLKKPLTITKTEDNALTYYPSVTFGTMSNLKAKILLNFVPSSLNSSLDKIIHFFLSEGKNYTKEYNKMIKDLPKQIRQILQKQNK